MLRITTIDAADGLTLRLEGRLAGVWVAELEDCWRAAASAFGDRPIRVDLSGVEGMDAAGKYLLALMHGAGARLSASGCASHLVTDIQGKWSVCSRGTERKA